jgi:hypothetical protein
MALVGDYAAGVERLKEFLETIELPEVRPLIQQALEFLGRVALQS